MTAKTTVLIPPDGTPCSAVRITPYPYDDDESDKLCGKAATYCVNGKNYCTVHAGKAALAILINGVTPTFL